MKTEISIRDLKKSYRVGFWLTKHEALNSVSFEVRSHRMTGFIGANGAGKTTTIRCLLGFTQFSSGQISFFDGQPISPSVRKRIGYLPEQPNFYDQLTGFEFLKLHSGLSGFRFNRDHILKQLKRVELDGAIDRKLREYSKGMLQRIGLVQSFIHEPELLILDEPMSGLDPDGRRLVKSLLREISKGGVTIFFSTHLLDDVEDLCDDVVLMAGGQVKYFGDLERLIVEYEKVGSKKLEDIYSAVSRESIK